MSWIDYLLLALIGGYCVYLLLRKKKKDGCCGDCSRCGGCCCEKRSEKYTTRCHPILVDDSGFSYCVTAFFAGCTAWRGRPRWFPGNGDPG